MKTRTFLVVNALLVALICGVVAANVWLTFRRFGAPDWLRVAATLVPSGACVLALAMAIHSARMKLR